MIRNKGSYVFPQGNDYIQYSEKAPIESKDVSLSLPSTCSNSDDDDDEPKAIFEPSNFDKIINTIFCRRDLAKQKLTAKPVSVVGLFRYAKFFDEVSIFIGTVCAIIGGLGQPAMAVITCRICNIMLTVPANTDKFWDECFKNVYFLVGLSILMTITNYLQYLCFSLVCVRVIAKIKQHYVHAALRQNAGWFDRHQSGSLTTTLNDNIERIREGIGDKLGILVRGTAMFIGALGVSFYYEWRVSLVMLGVAPISAFIMGELSQLMELFTIKESEGVGEAGSVAEEAVSGVRTVQAFNGQEEVVKRYADELERGKRHGVIKSLWSGFLGGLFFFFLNAFTGAGVLYGGHLLQVGVVVNPGDVLTAMFSMLLGAYLVGLVSPHLMVLLNARVSAATVYQTIDRVPKIDAYSIHGKIPKNIRGKIVFKNVHFRYPTRKDVKIFNGLNLVIEPGQTVALVGHSGCGKSTSVGLLTRLYEPELGSVTIDGIDVREFQVAHLRNIIGIVQQEPVLFNDTLENNLKFGAPDATLEQMKEACRIANAEQFVVKLPQGFKTRIGEGGVQLSGGQKQRIAIARVLLRNPKILLLDEATSALDASSEGVVQEALNNALVGRTTIMIAHRLSTIQKADKICVFEKGEIVEQGTHHELVELGGRYAQLVKAQQFQQDEDAKEDENEVVEEKVDLGVRTPEEALTARLEAARLYRKAHMNTLSRRSGTAAFIRGIRQNNSFLKDSRHFSTATQYLPSETFAIDAPTVSDDEERWPSSIFQVVKEAKGNYTYLVIGTFWALMCGLYLPSVCLITKFVFESFATLLYDDHMFHRLCMAMIMFCGCGFGVTVSQFLSSALYGIASENTSISFRTRSFHNILLQDAEYFDKPEHTPGKLITRLATDAPNVKAVIDSRMLQVIYGVTAMAVNIIIGYINCWQVTTLGTGCSLSLAGLQVFLALWIQTKTLRLIESDEGGRLAVEIFENVKTIQLLTREKVFYKNYEVASKQSKRTETARAWIEAINFCVSQTFQFYMQVFTFTVGIYIMHEVIEPPNKVFVSITAMLLGSVGLMNSASYFPEFVKARATSGLLFAMIYRKPKTGDYKQGQKTELEGTVLFENVHFAYPLRPREPVMKGLQFAANRGQTVALVGPSGCGKSTAIAMLERFYDPSDGVVRFDGNDLSKLSLYHLRTQVALVGQEPRLFAGSIRQNICLGMETPPSEEQIKAALELANAIKFVQALPQGLDTDVGEKGSKLSGGQKQRIAIARALVRDPKVLLLDEATSALDSEAEKAVQEALDRAREGRTCITIAHRLSSIQNSDLIIYVDNGKVQEAGTHNQLMAKKGKYYKLIKMQDLTG